MKKSFFKLFFLFCFFPFLLLAELQPCTIVIFGATGDLMSRKLSPAIYNLAKQQQLSENTAIVGLSRVDQTDEAFQDQVIGSIRKHSPVSEIEGLWDKIKNKFYYHAVSFDQDRDYKSLYLKLKEIDQKIGTKGNRLYYIASHPSYFATIIEKLKKHDLISAPGMQNWSRVIIEKPFGHDLTSAIALQQNISEHLSEDQIYRIDHYLGKEGVQNLLSFRQENPEVISVWNKEYIDNVQITISEDIGIAGREAFWEQTGYLRDIVQNHLIQLLTLIAMELPKEWTAENIHAEKIKILNEIQPIKDVIRGQYGPGNGMKGYLEENDVPETSFVETFMAAKLFIDNKRWQGVPFYIRGGKRLPRQIAEIAVVFKNESILFIRIQPKSGVFYQCKDKLIPIPIKNQKQSSDAYDKLISDCIEGNSQLFVKSEEQFASWKLFTPILETWKSEKHNGLLHYPAGTWGPKEADLMLENDNRKWVLTL